MSNTAENVIARLIHRAPAALPTGCWEWPGRRCSGHYGQISFKGRLQMVHRIVYEHLRAPVPEGMELDHECRNRLCANPDHLQLLTRQAHRALTIPQPYTPPAREPVIRRQCPHGLRRVVDCAACRKEYRQKWAAEKRTQQGPRLPQTHCKHGHALEGENLRVTVSGGRTHRVCRACCRIRAAARRPPRPEAHRPRPQASRPRPEVRQEYCSSGHPLSGDNLGRGKDRQRFCRICRREECERRRIERAMERAAQKAVRQPSDSCPQGHPRTPENTYTTPSGQRQCRTCRAYQSERQRQKLADGVYTPQHRKTHCIHGHAYEGDNLYVSPRGQLFCRQCQREKDRRRRRK